MFVHPNQVRFALTQTAAFSGFQGSITHVDNRDYFKLRVAMAPDQEEEREGLAEKIKAQVRGVCRVKVDEVVFVGVGEIAADAAGMVDERVWH
jgi:hypothetical protein